MTLMEHLHELRHRVFLAVLALFVGAVIGFIWFSVEIPALHITSLGDILTEPYCAIPVPPRVEFSGDGGCQLLATTAFSALQLRLIAAVLAGFLISCPMWLYQLWAYVGPALYSKEKRFALGFTGAGAGLFIGGMVLAYLVIPEALKVLVGFGGDFVSVGLDPVGYYKFLVGMMLIFGVSLELPLLLVMLNFAGVLKGAQLAKARRYAFFGLVVFAGIAVPGNDPTSMGVLAVVLCILYEIAVQISKAHDKRKLKVAAKSMADLPDDVASPLDTSLSDDAGAAFTPRADAAGASPDDVAEPIPAPTPLDEQNDSTAAAHADPAVTASPESASSESAATTPAAEDPVAEDPATEPNTTVTDAPNTDAHTTDEPDPDDPDTDGPDDPPAPPSVDRWSDIT